MKNEERIYGMSVPVPACEFETRKKWKKKLSFASYIYVHIGTGFSLRLLTSLSLLFAAFFVFFSNFTLQPNVGSNDGS